MLDCAWMVGVELSRAVLFITLVYFKSTGKRSAIEEDVPKADRYLRSIGFYATRIRKVWWPMLVGEPGSMAKERKTIRVSFDFPVEIEQGKAGLVYVTSPLIRGLLIAEENEEEALRRVPDALAELSKAAASYGDKDEGR